MFLMFAFLFLINLNLQKTLFHYCELFKNRIFFMKEEENPWKTLKSKETYSNSWIKVTEHQTVNTAKKEGIYGVVHFKNIAIGIIPLDEDYNTWLVGQYRYPLKAYSWEICEGGGLIGEDVLSSAKRELLEELGIKAKDWNYIMNVHLSNSVTDEKGVIYIAKNLTFQTPEPEDCEVLQIKKLPFKEVINSNLSLNLLTEIILVSISKSL